MLMETKPDNRTDHKREGNIPFDETQRGRQIAAQRVYDLERSQWVYGCR
jgi:hypothetical protein